MNNKRDRLDLVIKKVFSRMKKLNSNPNTCPGDELLAAYIDGSLTQKEGEIIEEHLVLCNECTENLMSFSEMQSLYHSNDETFTTVEMVKRAKNLLKQPREKRTLWELISSWFPFMRPVPVMASASIALVLLVFCVYHLQKPHRPLPEISSFIKFTLIARIPDKALIRGTTLDYKEVEIKNGGMLQSGDMFRIKFELQEETYVYLLALDSLGNLIKLFPGKDTLLPIKVKPHKTYVFPEKDEWLRLDDNIGKESLYLLASPDIIENIGQKIVQLKKAGIDNINKIFPGVNIKLFSFKHE